MEKEKEKEKTFEEECAEGRFSIKPNRSMEEKREILRRTAFDWHEERKARQCKACKHWAFTETIGSKDKPVWHCRHGFTPSKDCKEMADYNDKCKAAYYRKNPEDLQLSFNF